MNTTRSWTRYSAALFPLALWFVATFFLLGDIGRWLDDWIYVQRVPESGAIRSLVLDRPLHFWRPLYKAIVPTLATLLSEHVQFHHFLCAMMHGANAIVIWRLLLALGIRRLAAAIAALFFLTFPASFEVVFWLCNLPTAVSTLLCLSALLLTAIMARRGHSVLLTAAALAVTAFVAACLNEQPPAMLLTAPLVWCLAISQPPISRALVRGWPLITAVLVSLAIYSVCHHRFAPSRPAVNGESFFIALDRLPTVAGAVAKWSWEWTTSIGSMRRALWHAGHTAAEHPIRAMVAGGLLLIAATAWARYHVLYGHDTSGHRDPRLIRPAWLVLLGLAVGVSSIAPIVATNYWLNPRVLYAPGIGLSIIIAGLCMIPGARGSKDLGAMRDRRLIAAAVAAIVLCAMAGMMVGIQRSFQLRDRADARAMQQLQTLVPDPTEGTVFVPVRIDDPHHPPWAARYEQQFWSVFRAWWSSSWALRLHFKRSDIDAGFAINGPAWSAPNMRGVYVAGVGRVEWPRVVPFTVDSDGRVRLLNQVRWLTPTNVERELRLDHVNAAGDDLESPFVFPVTPQ